MPAFPNDRQELYRMGYPLVGREMSAVHVDTVNMLLNSLVTCRLPLSRG